VLESRIQAGIDQFNGSVMSINEPTIRSVLLGDYLSDYRMYSGPISQDFQTVHNVDRPRGSHDRHANAATVPDWTSKLITLLFDQVEDQWKLRNEALHGRQRSKHSLFRRALLCAKATRLSSTFTPTLKIYWHSTVRSPRDHSPLS
jgi:hypothetical protein